MDRKKRSELEENELEGITETELARLQRQYRIMDNDRKAYYKETQTVLRKQRSAQQPPGWRLLHAYNLGRCVCSLSAGFVIQCRRLSYSQTPNGQLAIRRNIHQGSKINKLLSYSYIWIERFVIKFWVGIQLNCSYIFSNLVEL